MSPETGAQVFFWVALAGPGVCVVLWTIYTVIEGWGGFHTGYPDDDYYSAEPPPRTQADVVRDARAVARAMDDDARRTAEAMHRAAVQAQRRG
jgi:hypothetical protein